MTYALIVCSNSVYSLIDPGSILSYVTLFIVGKLFIVSKTIDRSFTLCTQLGESIILKRFYRGCTIEIIDRQTTEDLLE